MNRINQLEIKKLDSISILDIYGFEDMKCNGFEQLCINYANEKLLQVYTHYVFNKEKAIYEEEGMFDIFANIKLPDNENIINFFDKPPNGLL